ncbi:antitermination protein Q [Dickeya poaceiphila]|uniref:antitermination protein Q n=1 Tax=Dickeya poaceiphila TaxID=568768 RepID=UPI0005B514B6|nr:antitermination protein [Dickeya poaceiphila]
MNLESIPKFFSPKSPKLSDESPATASDRLGISDVMAAIGMSHQSSGIGMDLFLAKIGVSSPDKAIEGLIEIAKSLAGHCKPLSELDADSKLRALQLLATFAYHDYARSAASVKRCPDCDDGFIDVEVFSLKAAYGKRVIDAMPKIEMLDKPLACNVTHERREIVRVQCPTCKGRGLVSNSCRCRGRGIVIDERATAINGGIPVTKECERCHGTGYSRLPAESVRRALCAAGVEISQPTWSRHVKPMYERLVSACHQAESTAEINLRRVTS